VLIAAAILSALTMAVLGQRGKQHAILLARLEDADRLSAFLQRALEGEQERRREFLDGADSASDAASRPWAPDPRLSEFAASLKTRLEQPGLNNHVPGLPSEQTLRIKLAWAVLSNAGGQFRDALTALSAEDEHLGISSGDPLLAVRILQARGDAFFGLHAWQDALDRYRQIQEIDPDHLAAMSRLTASLAQLEKSGEAMAASIYLAKLYSRRGTHFLFREKYDDALADYDSAARIQSRLIEGEGRVDLLEDLGATRNDSGNACLLQGKPAAALKFYEKAIELQADRAEKTGQTNLPSELARSYENRGNAFFAQGDLIAAQRDFERAVEIRVQRVQIGTAPEATLDLASSLIRCGNALLGQQKVESAVSAYDRALGLLTQLSSSVGPGAGAYELAMALNNRGVARRVQGQLPAAVDDFAAAIEGLNQMRDSMHWPESSMTKTGLQRGIATMVKLDAAMSYDGTTIDVLARTRLVGGNHALEPTIGLAMSLRNRGFALSARGEKRAALRDHNASVDILSTLVEQEDRDDMIPHFVKGLCALAWFLATEPDHAVRNGPRATELATRACQLTGWKAVLPMEALAAGLAESGDFIQAIKRQQHAIDLAPPARKAELQSRLNVYLSKMAYRVPDAGEPKH
jgi:tetratricopeptide (TPR) repeat protein